MAKAKIKAAGILYTDGKSVLFTRRGNGGDFPNMWAIPGGTLEDGESLIECAVRENLEELRYPTVGELAELGTVNLVSDADGETEVEFTTFRNVVSEPFTPILNYENTEFMWAPIGQWPLPLHPGAAELLRKEYPPRTELQVAEAIRDGLLPSPQRFENVALVAMRITGTGVAYRNPKAADLEEDPDVQGQYVFRDPSLYMTEEFLKRCNGLTVILEHPEGDTLDSKEFNDRVIGSIFVPYLKYETEEVWGIAKIYDAPAIELFMEEQLSTSPTVQFREADGNSIITLADGSTLLVEGKPSLLDHLAVCRSGVWDKGGEPSGIEINQGVSEMDMKDLIAAVKTAASDAATTAVNAALKAHGIKPKAQAFADSNEEKEKKADSEEEDKEKKSDSEEEEDKEKKADSEDKEKKADNEDGEKPGEKLKTAADKKADSEDKEKEADKKADASRVDPTTAAKVRDLEAQMANLLKNQPRQLDDSEYRAMADAQANCDRVAQAFGDSQGAPRPLQGESLLGYRKRLVSKYAKHSAAFKAVDISAINDAAMLDVVEKQVYADAMAAANSPGEVGAGNLREIVTHDTTGRRVSTFVGDPSVWTNQFKGPRQRLLGINANRSM